MSGIASDQKCAVARGHHGAGAADGCVEKTVATRRGGIPHASRQFRRDGAHLDDNRVLGRGFQHAGRTAKDFFDAFEGGEDGEHGVRAFAGPGRVLGGAKSRGGQHARLLRSNVVAGDLHAALQQARCHGGPQKSQAHDTCSIHAVASLNCGESGLFYSSRWPGGNPTRLAPFTPIW